MTKQHGKDLLIKIGNGEATETFTTIAALRSKSINLNRETIDITTADSANLARELLDGGGVKNIEFSGSGLVDSGTNQSDLLTSFDAGSIDNYQIIVPGIGTFEGPFQVSALTFGGEHSGEATFEGTFQSAGDWLFTAES